MENNNVTKMQQKKGDVVSRLSDIEVQEVSIVDKGANRRKWAVVKSEGMAVAEVQSLVDRYQAIKAGDAEALKALVKELLGQLSDEVLAEIGLKRLDVDEAAGTPPPDGEAPAEPTAEEMASAAVASAEKAEGKVREMEAMLKSANAELEQARLALKQVGSPQSGGEPRMPAPAPAPAQSSGMKTLGLQPLNK